MSLEGLGDEDEMVISLIPIVSVILSSCQLLDFVAPWILDASNSEALSTVIRWVFNPLYFSFFVSIIIKKVFNNIRIICGITSQSSCKVTHFYIIWYKEVQKQSRNLLFLILIILFYYKLLSFLMLYVLRQKVLFIHKFNVVSFYKYFFSTQKTRQKDRWFAHCSIFIFLTKTNM